jgi:hypothetical protein
MSSRLSFRSASWKQVALKSRVPTSSSSSLDHTEVSLFEDSCSRAPADQFTGLGVSVGRSALINMIFFSSFEQIKKRINNAGDIIEFLGNVHVKRGVIRGMEGH